MSSASLTGIAVLENPRLIDPSKPNSKPMMLDAQFFISSHQQPLSGALRYFNSTDDSFPAVGAYFVYAQVAKMTPGANIWEADDSKEYDIVGDIVTIIPADLEQASRSAPFVHLSGPATNVSKEKATFDIHAEQWCYSISKGTFPAVCTTPDSKRYEKHGKPSPNENSNVLVTGFLSAVHRPDDPKDKRGTFFDVTVHNIHFFGKSPAPPLPSETTTTPGASGKKKGFSFDFTTARQKRDRDQEGADSDTEESPTKHRKTTQGARQSENGVGDSEASTSGNKGKSVVNSSAPRSYNTRSGKD